MGSLTVLCSVGATHPWNIAGLGLDARVARHLGARQVSVVAGVTAQGGGEFSAVSVPPGVVAAQLRSVRELRPDAYRIGVLLAPANVAAVEAALADVVAPVVCDPVLSSSRGELFVEEGTLDALRRLFRRCTLVTPNLAEASRLCGFPVNDRATMAGAAHTLVERDGAFAALVTGGHLEREATDVLYTAGETIVFEGERLPGTMRGTGCVLAAAAAIALGRGMNVRDAIESARGLVRDAIAHAIEWNGERVWPW